MRKSTRLALGFAALAGAIATAAYAAEGPARMHQDMRMHKADADKSGDITFDEFSAAMKNRLDAADTNHDGKISHDEFVADAMRFFDMLDVNHDGYINSPENTRYETQIAPEIQRVDPRIQQPKNITHNDDDAATQDMPNGGRYLKQIVGASQYGLIDEPQPIRGADANFDFRVSKAEWLTATNQRFAILDRNGDGYITPDELPRTPAQLAQESGKNDRKYEHRRKKHSRNW